MNNYAKYQHPKQKLIIFLKNPKIALFTLFEGIKNRSSKEKNCFSMFQNLDEQLYQICSTLDEIFQHKPTHWTPWPLIPPSLCSQLSLIMGNFCRRSYTFCLRFILFLHVGSGSVFGVYSWIKLRPYIYSNRTVS